MAHERYSHGVAAVAGGLAVVGSPYSLDVPNELYDEASGRWFELPHPMAAPRYDTQLVPLPASALLPLAAAGGVAAAAQ